MVEEFLSMVQGFSTTSMIVRLVCAVITGTVIGIDRALKRRGAGIKTHVLVCLGAAMTMMTGQYIQLHFEANMDVARLGAQVINGVGFLGVGTIMVTGRNQVRGLTTAAGLWACACIGLAIGIGFLDGAVLALLLVFFTFKVLNRIDGWMHKYAKVFDLYLEFPTNKCVSLFVDELHRQEIKIVSFELGKSKIKGEGPNAILCIEVKDRSRRPRIVDDIRNMDCVKFVEEL